MLLWCPFYFFATLLQLQVFTAEKCPVKYKVNNTKNEEAFDKWIDFVKW